MNSIQRLILLVAALALPLSSCSDTSEADRAASSSTVPVVFGMAPAGADVPDISAMTPEQRDVYGAALTEVQIAITQAAATADTWSDADRQVRQALRNAAAAGLPAYQIESLAATHMLYRAVQSGRASEAPAADIGYYTDLLVRNESPNASLIADALDALGETWEAGRIEEAAARTLVSTRRYEARARARSGQGRHTLSPAVDRAIEAGSLPAQDERTSAAVRRLQTLAEG